MTMTYRRTEKTLAAAKANLQTPHARKRTTYARKLQAERRHQFIAFVLRCNAFGLMDKQIAERVGRLQSSVNSIISHEMRRLNVNTRIQLFFLYIKEGHLTNEHMRVAPSDADFVTFTQVNLRAVIDDE
jgi:DNA-binding NarL/FixJ family response regulator